jgi:PAS domain S-box-containing protein
MSAKPESSRSRVQDKLPRDLYQAIFTHSSEPIAIIDTAGFYLEQNSAHAQLLGYTDAELENQTPAIHLGQEVFSEIVEQLALNGEYRGEVVCKTKAGEIRHVELSAFTMRNGSAEPVCFVGIKRDITERKKSQEALQRSETQRTDLFDNAAVSEELFKRERAARAEAEKANRLKDEFLATLSHELRTPLNAVIGWSRMLGSGRLDRESSKHALEVIERNAWAQKQIIEDILDVSRVITGKLQLNLGPLDLVAVIDAALDAVRPAMEAKDIRIETIIDASLRMISGDADRLQQAVWNILSNAAKFTPAGGKVEISVSQTATHVHVQVKDSGPGIDPAFLPHVFERFRQADGSTTRAHGGLGLGLAIVRHLVELHGGTIGVENRTDDKGAIFTIRLPLPSGELRPEALPSASSIFKDAQQEQQSLDGLKILLVDDETDTLDLISVELAQHGAKVTGVPSAEEALKALEQFEFDVLISDIGMPNTDGYDLIRQVRKHEQGGERRLPAVALTAYARVQDRMRAILAGFSTHIAKPVEANELVTVVASLAGRLGKG